MRLLGLGAAPLLGALKLVTGVDLISDLTAFFTLLGGMTDEFNARAERVERLLHAPETAFVLVTSAESRPIDEAIWFRETLREHGMPFTGAIVNRVHPPLVPRGEGGWEQILAPDLRAKLAASIAEHSMLAERDAAGLDRLRVAFAGEPILQVPELDGDIHDVQGLLAMREELFDD
jgi:anion-transporting  ArsA/GET3 family ATPase